ncbi:MAG: hypothetical protein ACOYOQ_16370 [Microthrixaceae bacterium]
MTGAAAAAALTDGAGMVAVRAGDVVGFLGARPDDVESAHFGLGVDRVTDLIVEGSHDRGDLGTLLWRALVEQRRGAGRHLLIANIDGDDMAGLNASLRVGSTYCESAVAYVCDTELGPSNLHQPHSLEFRVSEPKDLCLPPDALDVIRERIPASRWYDHFHADPRLPDAECDALYEMWFDRAIAGEWADLVVLALRDDSIVGVTTWKHWTHFDEEHGASMLAQPIGVAVPNGYGMIRGMFPLLHALRPFNARFWDMSTSVRNREVNATLPRMFGMSMARSTHVLHLWTDELR